MNVLDNLFHILYSKLHFHHSMKHPFLFWNRQRRHTSLHRFLLQTNCKNIEPERTELFEKYGQGLLYMTGKILYLNLFRQSVRELNKLSLFRLSSSLNRTFFRRKLEVQNQILQLCQNS